MPNNDNYIRDASAYIYSGTPFREIPVREGQTINWYRAPLPTANDADSYVSANLTDFSRMMWTSTFLGHDAVAIEGLEAVDEDEDGDALERLRGLTARELLALGKK